jgi:hypothetical protein
MKRQVRLGLVMVGSLVAAWAPALAQRASPLLFDRIETGGWEIRVREPGGQVERLCLRDQQRIIQLRHPAANCEHLLVSKSPSEVTVQYTCPGRGYGRTSIRIESPRLIQIDSQGIAGGLPFSFTAEGRRTGDCAP